MTITRAVIVFCAVAMCMSSGLTAQRLNHPTPGIPRLPSGKPDLSAPAPKTADGRT